MGYRDRENETEQIKEIKYRTTPGGVCEITWHWDKSIDGVYIYESLDGAELCLDKFVQEEMKFFTQGEYKDKGYYRISLARGIRRTYYFYPYKQEKGEVMLICQNNIDNKIVITSGKLPVYYTIKERKSWFGSDKRVQIIVETESIIPKDVLCYIADDNFSKNKHDKVIYHFNEDISPPKKIFGGIRFKKDTCVRLILSNKEKYGETYNLIRKQVK